MNVKKMLKKSSSYHDELIRSLHDSQQAALYLQIALDEYQEDNDPEAFLIALRNVTEAHGGIAQIAKKAHINRQSLYKTLSPHGNPRLQTLSAILKVLGFSLIIQPVHA